MRDRQEKAAFYKRPGTLIALTIIVVLAALVTWGAVARSSPGKGLQTEAPDFMLTLFDGERLSLSSLRGQPVVLNFWASWCKPCRDEAPTLEKAWRAYQDKGVVFLGIDVQDTEAAARSFMQTYGISYRNGPDQGNRIAPAYGVTGVPETYFISRDGRLVRRWIGPISEPLITSYIEELLR